MRRFRSLTYGMVSVLMVILLLALPLCPAAQAKGGWTCTVTPSFAFIGDNVTIKITGVPEAIAFLRMLSPNGTKVDETTIMTDDVGQASYNYTVPVLLASGNYTIRLIYKGNVEVETSFQAIFDDVVYLTSIVNSLKDDINKQKEYVFQYSEMAIKAQNDFNNMLVLFCFSVGSVIIISFTWFRTFKPWTEWKVSRYRGASKLMGGVKFILNPPPDGDHSPYVDGTREERLRILRQRNLDDRPKTYLLRKFENTGRLESMEVEEVNVDSPKLVDPTPGGLRLRELEAGVEYRPVRKWGLRFRSRKAKPVDKSTKPIPHLVLQPAEHSGSDGRETRNIVEISGDVSAEDLPTQVRKTSKGRTAHRKGAKTGGRTR